MKRLISLFLTLCLLVSILPAIPLKAQAEEAVTTSTVELWTDFAADSYAGGGGSESNPYLIATAEQLARMAYMVNERGISHTKGGYYELIADIDLSAYPWVPIGQEKNNCNVLSFSGNGHTISGLTLNSDSMTKTYGGLFGDMSTTTIRDLKLTDVIIDMNNCPSYYVGCVAGFAKSCVNVEVSGDIFIDESIDKGTGFYGGIAGELIEGSTNCSFTGNIDISTTSWVVVGGISGDSGDYDTQYCTKNCRSSGSITINSTYENDSGYEDIAGVVAGGIIGRSLQRVSACYSTMNISSTSYDGIVGGVLGRLIYDGMSNCYATGTISLNTTFTNATNSDAYAGGLVGGWDRGDIKNCYTRNPSVTSIKSNTQVQTYAGKLAGRIPEELGGTCTNSYVSASTTLKRNGFKDGGDCDADSYPVVDTASAAPETGTFTYSENFITDTLGWSLYEKYHSQLGTTYDVWILGGENPSLFIDHIYSLTVRYWDPSNSVFDVSLSYHDPGSEYSITSPDLAGGITEQTVVTGIITEDTYLDVYYTHEHTPGPEATCTAPQTCTSCGGVLVEMLPHDYAVTEIVQPSCTENGYTLRTCQVCSHVTQDSYVSPLGHELDLSYTCTRCGVAFGAPLRDYRVHVLDQETGAPIEGASVYLGSSTVLTDTNGIAAHQLSSEGPLSMIVRFEGYQNHNLSNFYPGEPPDTYVFLTSKDTGIFSAQCNGKDVLSSSAQINALAPTLEATVVVKGRAKAKITHYELVQGSAIIATSTDGVFTVKNPHFKQGQPVYARMYVDVAEGSNVFSIKLNIEVIGFTLDADTDWGKLLPFSAGMDLSFPEGTPVLEGLNFKIPSYAIGKNGFINVRVGNDKLMVTFGDKNDLDDEKDDLDGKTKTQLLKKMRDDWVKQNNPNAWPEGKKENEVEASFGMVIEFSSSGVTSVYGQANVAYNLSFQNGKTFLIWYIPIYAEVSASFGGEIKVSNLGYDFENAQVLIPNYRLSINGQITLREGIGCSVISAGVYGTAGASLIFGTEDLQQYVSYRLYGELGLYARLKLFFWKAMEYRLPLLSGEFSGSAGSYARRNMYSLQGYETVTRDYLKNRSPWLSYVPRSGNVSENVTMQTSSYTAIDPKLVVCGDTVMMVFADDNGSTGLNYQHLYYSLYQADTGIWTQPKRVDDNDLCDLEYEVCTDGKKIWIIYTQMDEVTEENQDAHEALLSTVEVTAAVYDPSQEAFTDHCLLTDDESFDSLPQLVLTPEGLRAAWVSNATNDAFSQNANNRLFTALYSGGKWSKPLALTQPGATSVSMDLGLLQNTAYVATVVDIDCDLATIEDRKVVLTDMNGTAITVSTSKNTNDGVQFGVLNGTQSLLWYQDNNLYSICAPAEAPSALFDKPIEGLGADYRLVTLSSTEQAIVYTQHQRWTDEEGIEQSASNLQAIFSKNGKWVNPITLTQPETERYVEGYDVQALNGKLLIPYISMSATVSSTDIQRSADFRCSYTAVPRDLAVGQAVYLPSALLENETIEVKVPFTNNSTLPIERVNYRVTDSNGILIKEGTPAASVGSGEEGWATVLLPRSSLTPGGSYSVTLLPTNWTDENLSNNTAELTLWYGDLSVSAEQLLLQDQQVQYAVSNEGNDTAQGIIEILLKEEDGSETLLHTATIDALAPGKSVSGTLEIDDALCSDNRVILVRATTASPELYDFNNEASLALRSLVRSETTEASESNAVTLSPEIATPYVTYNQRYGGSKTVAVTENGWTIASFSGVTSNGFSYTNGTLVLNGDWLQSLSVGTHSLTLGYKKDKQSTTVTLLLEIIDTTPPAAHIYAPDQVFQFKEDAPQLGTDVLYETDSQAEVTPSYSRNGNSIWQKGLPNEAGTYQIYLYVAEDTQNNLSESNCYFTLEIIRATRAISLPQVTALADGSYRFDRAVPTAGADDGVITYGFSTVNDPGTVEQWSEVGLIPAQEQTVTYYLFARVTDGKNYEDAYSLGEALNIHIHTYEATVTAPTCETPGFTTHICSVCQDRYTDAQTAPLGHSFTNYVSDNNATCTQNGTQTAVCDRCDVTDTQVLEDTATGHSFDEGRITSEPSCTQEGEMIFTCSCGEQYSTVLPANGHRYDTVVSPPSCEEPGFTSHTCSVCGDQYTDGQMPPTGHSFDEGVITQKATCTAEGSMIFCCNCGYQYTTVLPALGHDYVPAGTIPPTCELSGSTAIGCLNCGDVETTEIPPTGHSYTSTDTAPTCMEGGYTTNVCDACGKTEILEGAGALGHSFTSYVSDGNATCTEDGTKTAQCDRCAGTHTVIDSGSAFGHSFDGGTVTQSPGCITDGTITYRCDLCGDAYEDVIPATGHQYKTTVTAPSCEETGYSTHFCTVCGDTFVDSITPAAGHNYANGFCEVCGVLQPGYAIYSGSIQSYGDPTDPITVELIPQGSDAAAYTSVISNGANSFCFSGITASSYTLVISKKNHVTRYVYLDIEVGNNTMEHSLQIRLIGDITGEGKVNVGDVARLYGHIRKTSIITDEYILACAEVTGDGRINVGDTATLYSHVKNTKKLY